MCQRIAKHIYNYLSNKGILNQEDEDIYIYALEVIILNTSIFAVIFMISVMMKQLETIVSFLLFFVPLRIFCGGYHAQNSEICFVLSILSYVLVLIIVDNYPQLYLNEVLQVITVFMLIIMFILSPLVNENHPIGEVQYRRNKGIVRLLLVIDFVLLVLGTISHMLYCSCLMIFILLNGVLCMIGKIEQVVLQKNN